MHTQAAVQVWVEIDSGIADFVRRLQLLFPGVQTHTSCQGGETYGPYVMASWTKEAAAQLAAEGCTFTQMGDDDPLGTWGKIHPPLPRN